MLERADHSLMSSIFTLEDIPVIVEFGIEAKVQEICLFATSLINTTI